MEIMSRNDCSFCGKPLRGFFVLESLYCEVCDTCIASWLPLFMLEGGLYGRTSKELPPAKTR